MNEPTFRVKQAERSGQTRIIGGADDHSGPGPEIMDAHTLNGNEIVNRQNESLGEIEAIMLDVPHGRVAYAVLSFGGFLGVGGKLFAVPWHALVLDAERKCFILDASKEQLKSAPGFDKNSWPAMADTTWAQRIHDFYKTSPYWLE